MGRVWDTPLLGLLLPVLLAGCAELTLAEKEKLLGRNPPKIVADYAQDKMLHLQPWTIYLHGEDPDGDMSEIAASITVTGGQWEFAKVPLRRDLGGKFKGYVWLPLRPGRGHNFNTITVSLYVKDQAGHQSDEKKFSLDLGQELTGEEASRILAYAKEYVDDLGPLNVSLAFVEGDATGGGMQGGGGD